jgi:hypothetical protein
MSRLLSVSVALMQFARLAAAQPECILEIGIRGTPAYLSTYSARRLEPFASLPVYSGEYLTHLRYEGTFNGMVLIVEFLERRDRTQQISYVVGSVASFTSASAAAWNGVAFFALPEVREESWTLNCRDLKRVACTHHRQCSGVPYEPCKTTSPDERCVR